MAAVVQEYIELGFASAQFQNVPETPYFEAAGDFDDDGDSDLLWLDTQNAIVQVWEMEDGRLVNDIVLHTGVNSTQYQVEGIGDFNNDGFYDILWSDRVNGLLIDWQMNVDASGNAVVQDEITLHTGVNFNLYDVVATGDFGESSNTDIAFQNTQTSEITIWEMEDNAAGDAFVFNEHNLGVAPGQVVAVGDYNDDINKDIIFRDAAGNLTEWQFDNPPNDFTFDVISLGSASPQFEIITSVDLDSTNGPDDLLWRDVQNNQLIAWLMDDGTLGTVVQQPLGFISPEWDVVATGDFDATETSHMNDDLLWRNENTGQLQEWLFG
jgi:hypothetical protein